VEIGRDRRGTPLLARTTSRAALARRLSDRSHPTEI